MPTTPNKNRSATRLVWGIFITILLCALPAMAQDIEVTSAYPSSAEQETTDLVVTVGGDNFPSDSEVDFFVTGTEDPGGIHVKNVKRRGPKTLKVTVDVSAGATIDDFDIQVRSRGRSGKGIELFKVLEKSTGSDNTPPAPIEDLRVVDSSYWSVTLEWTMPGDDGDGINPPSGPVQTCYLHCGPLGEPLEKCRCVGSPYSWGNPGATQVCEVYDDYPHPLLQGTEYSIEVACRDEKVANIGDYREVRGTTGLYSEVQTPGWNTQEVPVPLDQSFGHAFDLLDNPLIVGRFGGATRIVRGSWSDNAWVWTPPEDIAAHSDVFAMDPWGQPAFAGVEIVSRHREDLLYTFHDGDGWVTELVTSLGRKVKASSPALAFDPVTGEAAIAYCALDNRDVGGLFLARRGSGGSWTEKLIDPDRCLTERNPFEVEKFRSFVSVAFSPEGVALLVYGVLVDEEDSIPDILRAALGTSQGWTYETVAEDNSSPWGSVEVRYSASQGHFLVAWDQGVCQRLGPGGWTCESPRSNHFGPPWFAVDGAGHHLFASLGAQDNEPGITLLESDPVTSVWTAEQVDYYQQYPWRGSFPTQEDLHLTQTPSSLINSPLLTDSPTLSWTWNVCAESFCTSNFSEYHLYFAWKTAP